MYPVAKRLHTDAERMAGNAICSPARKARMRDVARAVRVIATLIPAAKQSVVMIGENCGKTKENARPKAAPAAKNYAREK